MYATRRLLLSPPPSWGQDLPALVLPPRTITGLVSAACQGAWALMVDDSSRNAYEQAVKSNIIKDLVLSNATNGTLLTYALFHELQNPLFAKYPAFVVGGFVEAVGPALENYFDTLGRLRESLKTQLDAKLKHSDELQEIQKSVLKGDVSESVLGVNDWSRQAEQDPDSLAGLLSRMTTKSFLDGCFYATKLDFILQAQGFPYLLYEDCSVNEVALLSARAADIAVTEVDTDADAYTHKDLPVGAQMQVLFEVTHSYKAAPQEEGSNAVDSDPGTPATPNQLSVTHLAVAIFDSWLYRGPGPFRWKLAYIREAFEFPQSASVTR